MDLIIYPIPIRPDMDAQVQVPTDLTKAEAEKISRVILALADGEQPRAPKLNTQEG